MNPQPQLFEYVVLYHPQPTRDAAGNDTTPKSEILVDRTAVLAKSKDEAGLIAARKIPAAYDDRLSDVQVVVRPF